MKILNLLGCLILLILTAGCQPESQTSLNRTNNQVPSSAIVDTKPRDLFYCLTPPCSASEHYLHISKEATEYVWLFGAYNNGRHEENILIEKTIESIRLRAFWHAQSGELFCCDTEIGSEEFTSLQSSLLTLGVTELPNLSPDVSHAMTYWLKFADGSNAHEACAYCIELDLTDLFNIDEQSLANNWKNAVSAILSMRSLGKSKLCRSGFDEQGNVKWNGKAIPESEITPSIFN